VPQQVRAQFFERIEVGSGTEPSPDSDLRKATTSADGKVTYYLKRPASNRDVPRTLADIIGVHTGGPHGRRRDEPGHTTDKYQEFLDFIERLLQYDPAVRLSASDALRHIYVYSGDNAAAQGGAPAPGAPAGYYASGLGTSYASSTGQGASDGAEEESTGANSGFRNVGDKRRGRTLAGQPRIRSRSAPSTSSSQHSRGDGSGDPEGEDASPSGSPRASQRMEEDPPPDAAGPGPGRAAGDGSSEVAMGGHP